MQHMYPRQTQHSKILSCSNLHLNELKAQEGHVLWADRTTSENAGKSLKSGLIDVGFFFEIKISSSFGRYVKANLPTRKFSFFLL